MQVRTVKYCIFKSRPGLKFFLGINSDLDEWISFNRSIDEFVECGIVNGDFFFPLFCRK